MARKSLLKISEKALLNGDILAKLRFAYCADTERFLKAFQEIGMDINDDDDLQALAKLHLEGKDLDGTIKSTDGKVIRLDINKFINKIKIRHSKINNCSIRFV